MVARVRCFLLVERARTSATVLYVRLLSNDSRESRTRTEDVTGWLVDIREVMRSIGEGKGAARTGGSLGTATVGTGAVALNVAPSRASRRRVRGASVPMAGSEAGLTTKGRLRRPTSPPVTIKNHVKCI